MICSIRCKYLFVVTDRLLGADTVELRPLKEREAFVKAYNTLMEAVPGFKDRIPEFADHVEELDALIKKVRYFPSISCCARTYCTCQDQGAFPWRTPE